MEETNAISSLELLNTLTIQASNVDLLTRLRNLINVNELSKKYYLLPETTVPKRNLKKYLRGPLK